MYLNKFSKLFLAAGLVAITTVSCKKSEHISSIIPVQEAARFNKTSPTGSFYVGNPTTGLTFTVPVSISNASSTDRTLNLSYSSPTGAASGVQYNAPASVTIPAGETTSSFDITGIMSGYDVLGRKDLLVINITSPDTVYKRGTFWVQMQKYCNVILSELGGDYNNTYEGTYGPYTSSVVNLVMDPDSDTRATGVITNIYDSGINAEATFDWTDPANFSVTVEPQPTPYGVGGLQLFIRTSANTASSFSSCENTITMNFVLYTSAGVYDEWTSSMAK